MSRQPSDPAPTASREARLSRARRYPYDFPRQSYEYRDGALHRFDPATTRGRTPVLAVGSNQSPERLVQKFGHEAGHSVPVQRASLAEFDIVYSAHVASYGALPAMLQVSPGAEVSLAVTWLDERQLEIMHATEIHAANYVYAELHGLRLTLDDGAVLTEACAYVSSRGHLRHASGEAIALAAVGCRSRRFPEMQTTQALEHVRARLRAGLDPDEFVLRLVDEAGYRREVTSRLCEDAVAFSHPVRVVARREPR